MSVEGIEVRLDMDRADRNFIALDVTNDRVDFAGFVFSIQEAADLGAQLVAQSFKAAQALAARNGQPE